jgi:transketolase
MGLSLGIGLSIALKNKKNSSQVFVIMGDGECNEGSVWESALIAPNLKIDNLTVIIDKNNFQQTGSTDFILKNDNLKSKWESFNWDVDQIDGHNYSQIYNTIKKKNKNRNKLIICNTIKGNGVSFFEGNNDWHHNVVSSQLYKNALKEIKQND